MELGIIMYQSFFCSILLMRYVDKRILILICLLSIGLSQYKIIPYNKVFTYYINPFNFLIYMIIGSYLKDYLRRDKYSILFFFLGLSMILFSILCGSFGEKKMPVYFNYSCIPFAVGVLFIFSYLLQRISIPILIKIGKYSFVIYLFHMQIAGFVNGLFEKISIIPQFEFIKIFIAVGIVYIVLLLFKRLLIRREVLIDSFGYR